MQATNQRRHSRVACDLPIEIVGPSCVVFARLADLSRSGLRLRVPEAALGLRRLAPAGMIGGQVLRVLGVEFEGRMHPQCLGSLLTKRLRPIRIGRRDAGSGEVEIGCMLSPPLTDDEAAMLGVGLPELLPDEREGTTRGAAVAPRVRTERSPAPTEAPTAVGPVRPPGAPIGEVRRPVVASETKVRETGAVPSESKPSSDRRPGPGTSRRVDWRAYLHPSGASSIPPLVARAEIVSSEGVRVRVADRTQLSVGGGADVASTMSALDAIYGSEVSLRLMDGTTHAWTGPARIDMVEVGPVAPHVVTIWLRYTRALRPSEVRALGLGGRDE